MTRVISCQEYAAEFPQHMPAENNYGDLMDASAFADCHGSVEVRDSYHLYLPPASGVHPRFDNVRVFLWTDDSDEDYLITCVSGAVCVVSAVSADEANAQWSAEPYAEPCIPSLTRLATEEEAAECAADGHDYR